MSEDKHAQELAQKLDEQRKRDRETREAREQRKRDVDAAAARDLEARRAGERQRAQPAAQSQHERDAEMEAGLRAMRDRGLAATAAREAEVAEKLAQRGSLLKNERDRDPIFNPGANIDE